MYSKETINKPLILGVTGGIGSGKSTIVKVFTSFGIKVYNSDVEAKLIINSNENVKQQLKEAFGSDIYTNEVIDTKKLSAQVFNNEVALKKINSIVHPEVKRHFENWVLENNTSKILIKEAAILIESGAYKNVDKIILVTASEQLRIKRVCLRDKTNEEEVKNRIKVQMSDEEKMKFAHYVIKNNEEDLILPQVLKILESI